MDENFRCSFFKNYKSGVEDDGNFVFKIDYCMNVGKRNAVERRFRADAVDDEVGIIVDFDVVGVGRECKKEVDVEGVGRRRLATEFAV